MLEKNCNKLCVKTFYGFGSYFIVKNSFVAPVGVYGACRCIVALFCIWCGVGVAGLWGGINY